LLLYGLATFGCDPLEALRMLAVDADNDLQLPGAALSDYVHVAGIDGRQLIVDAPGSDLDLSIARRAAGIRLG
jgi:hypothetical protein